MVWLQASAEHSVRKSVPEPIAGKPLSAGQGPAKSLESTLFQPFRNSERKSRTASETARRQSDGCSRLVLCAACSRRLFGSEIGRRVFYLVVASLDQGSAPWERGALHTRQCLRLWHQYVSKKIPSPLELIASYRLVISDLALSELDSTGVN